MAKIDYFKVSFVSAAIVSMSKIGEEKNSNNDSANTNRDTFVQSLRKWIEKIYLSNYCLRELEGFDIK